MNQLPYKTWGEETKEMPIYFAHANGFPPETYQPIIDALADKRQVISYLQRPLWQPAPSIESIDSWFDLADDVIRFFDENKLKNVVAVGHSLGSVTAFMAALKRPDLFKALVMMEPVTLPWLTCWITRTFPKLVKKRVKIITKTLGRPHRFDSKQAAFDFHRKSRTFKNISDDNLWHYINAAVGEKDGEYQLVYPREWEARIYGTVSYFRNQLVRSQMPVLALRGKYSDTIAAKFWQKWQTNSNHQFVDFPENGHLVPVENPDAVIEKVIPFVEQHL